MTKIFLIRTSALALLAALAPAAAGSALALSGAASALAQEAEQATRYTCPMHPHYISDDPGSCPICGMDLVPMSGSAGLETDATSGARGAVVTVAPETLQMMGVRVAEAELAVFGGVIRAFAQIEADERARHTVSLRVPGWIETLQVRAVGDPVEAGDLLFEFYSPDLVAAQMDYFSARASNERRARAALRRLESLGMGPTAIARMRERGEALRRVPVFARRRGVVSALGVVEGGYVDIGEDILTLQDYSQVWVIAEVPQGDLHRLEPGRNARVSPAAGGAPLTGEIDFIYPTFDARTRTGRVRIVVENPDGTLRPGAFANIEFEGRAERRLAVPSEAVLFDQSGAYVIASLGEGRFEPRMVQTGLVRAGFTEILGGVSAGETVIASGQFLIDSESRLRESFARMRGADAPLSSLSLSETEFAMVDHVVDAALYVHEALRDGYDVQPAFFDPAIDAARLMAERYPGRLATVMEASITALEAFKAARASSQLQEALSELTQALRPWLLSHPRRYEGLGLRLYEADGRAWLEVGGARPFNPYGDGVPEPIDWPDAPPSQDDAGSNDAAMSGEGLGHVHH
jgi:Cu(I)/Ag(I) efflux system membrane fusion protein